MKYNPYISRRSVLQGLAGAAVTTAAFGLGANPAAVAKAAMAPKRAAAQTGPLQIAYINQQQAAQSDQRAQAGFEQWMTDNAIEWDVVVSDAKGDPGTLSNMISDAVTKEVDAIVVAFGTLTAAQGALEQVAAANIPFFSIDSGYFPPAICDITSNNYIMGAQMGSYLTDRLLALGKTEANICKITANFHHGTRKRGKELDTVLTENENIKILDERVIQYDKFFETTQNTVNDWLTRFPDQIDAIWCPWDEPAMAASQAILSHGLTVNDIFVIGCDGHPPAVEEMRDPDYPFVATAAQAFELWGGLVGNYILEIVGNGRPAEEVVPVKVVGFPAPFIVKEVNLPEAGAPPWDTVDFYTLFKEQVTGGAK